MKRIIIALFVFLPAVAFANDGLYIGVSGNRAHTDHTLSQVGVVPADFDLSFWGDNVRTDKSSVGFGFNLGYKVSFADFYLSPEIFFDQLDNRATDPTANADSAENALYLQDKLTLNFRYGAQLNLGHYFTENFAGFVTGGFANVDYDVHWNSLAGGVYLENYTSYGSDKLAALYGLGVVYDFTDNLSTKFSYDVQEFAIRYQVNGLRSSVELETFKLALNYNF